MTRFNSIVNTEFKQFYILNPFWYSHFLFDVGLKKGCVVAGGWCSHGGPVFLPPEGFSKFEYVSSHDEF